MYIETESQLFSAMCNQSYMWTFWTSLSLPERDFASKGNGTDEPEMSIGSKEFSSIYPQIPTPATSSSQKGDAFSSCASYFFEQNKVLTLYHKG